VIASVHRYFSHVQGADPHYWNTEFMFLEGGRFDGSVLVDGQWIFRDYDEREKKVLLSNFDPRYHFVIIDESTFWRARIRDDR
jgi:hypothetical protein